MMRDQPSIACCVLLAGLLFGGCSELRLSGSIPRAASETTSIEPPLEVAWTKDVGGACGPDAMHVQEGALFVGTRNGHVSVLEIETGRTLTRGDLGGVVEGGVQISEMRTLVIPVADEGSGVVSYNLRSGNRNWTLEEGPHYGVLLMGDRVIAAAYDGTVRALSLESGAELWTVSPESGAGFRVAPVQVDSESFVTADDSGVISQRSANTGELEWTLDTGNPVLRPMAVAGGELLLPSTRGMFTSIDVRSQNRSLEMTLDSTVRFAPPLVNEEQVYVGTSEGTLYAFDLASAEMLWSHTFDGVIDARPAVSGSHIYIPTLDLKLHALNREDGSHTWTTNLPGRIKTNVVSQGGFLLACREPHHVVAFRSGTQEIEE